MPKRSLTLVLVPFALVFVAVNLVFFTVDATEYAVITQFGQPVRARTAPGLYLKWPDPVESVQRMNRRLLVYTPEKVEYLTRDKKNVTVETYVAWRIADPVAYLQSIGSRSAAETRLQDLVAAELGAALGQIDLPALVTTGPGKMELPRLFEAVTRRSSDQAGRYGLEIVDVQAKLVNFPDKNKASVFARMKADREAIARQYRSEGSEQAARIRAEAEREQKTILSEAYSKAERTRGEGDAEAIRIYAQAYGQDPEFYQFLRTLDAYDKFVDDKTTLVLPADSELLKYLSQFQARPTETTAAASTAGTTSRQAGGR